MAPPLMTRRALNRALLARQHLLERAALEPLAAVEHLVGMQAQEPQAPYHGLWTRLARFDPGALSSLLEARQVVRGSLMRVTVHLVSAADYAHLRSLLAPVLIRQLRGSPFGKQLGDAPLEDIARAAAPHLREGALSRPEIAERLAERFPDASGAALAQAAMLLGAVVQVPPRGLWRRGGQARFTAAEQWLGRPLHAAPSAEELVPRYLAAFGPAGVRDMQAWSGLTRMAGAFERLRHELLVFRDEAGTELFDLPEAPRPDPRVAAPVRILAPFDNLILSHAERSRVIAPDHRPHVFGERLMRTFLLVGFVAGTWQSLDGAMRLSPLRTLKVSERRALIAEAQRTSAFLGLEREPRF